MKLFWKILAGFLLLIIISGIGLRLYFNDERLREMVVPIVNESLGTKAEIDAVSLSLFSSFPDAGVRLNGMRIADKEGQPLVALDELLISVKIMPLLRSDYQISELVLNKPEIYYTVYEDGSTNIDFLMSEEEAEADTTESALSLAIPELTLRQGNLFYDDRSSGTGVEAKGLSGTLALKYTELIETTLDASLDSLSVRMDGEPYIENLAVNLQQSSTLDLENERLTLSNGKLGIRGLTLDLEGEVGDWGAEKMQLDLSIKSNSDNFGELLGLVPPEYESAIANLETRGELKLEGTISGYYGEDELPDFNFNIAVNDGYIKNNELPEAIRDIQLSFVANNQSVAINTLEAKAGANSVSGKGKILNPLEDNPSFEMDFNANADLSTVKDFYPISEFGVQRLAGKLKADILASGEIEDPENAQLKGDITLTGGLLQYEGVPKPVQNIEAKLTATNQKITIERASMSASNNKLSLSGAVLDPLDTKKMRLDMNGKAEVDLATVKEFYPLDEEELTMRGKLTSNFRLQGGIDEIEIDRLLKGTSVRLRNGYIAHASVANPIEDITFDGKILGRDVQIDRASFKTGSNSLAIKGKVQKFMSDDPVFNLKIDGEAHLNEVEEYYSLKPWVDQLSGRATLNLSAQGPAGDPLEIKLNGALTIANVEAKGGELPLPISKMGGKLSVTPNAMNLESFSMLFGSSDIQLSGKLNHYLSFMRENVTAKNRPAISGSYHSKLLDLDEMIDWDEETEESDEPIPIELPNMEGKVTANIELLKVLGFDITDIKGSARLTPKEIVLSDAEAGMFEGKARGDMTWKVPNPTKTEMVFSGELDQVSAPAFFRESSFLGENSDIHEYLTGDLSAKITYQSKLDPTLSPIIKTTVSEGSFGMSKARLKGHPTQVKIANLLGISELKNVALDKWESEFTIKDEVLTLTNLNLTSGDIGLELNGTQHLVTEKIDYKATIALPGSFKGAIQKVISKQATDALTQENGTIGVPLVITGTSANPKVRPDDSVIKSIVEEYLKGKGKDLIKNLFGGDGK